jgi:hypothetical protein
MHSARPVVEEQPLREARQALVRVVPVWLVLLVLALLSAKLGEVVVAVIMEEVPATLRAVEAALATLTAPIFSPGQE